MSFEACGDLERARSGRARRPAAVLAWLVAGIAVLQGWQHASRWAGIDFYQFWVVGQAARELPGRDVYSAESRELIGRIYLKRARARAAAEADPGQVLPQAAAAEARAVLETYSTPWLYTVFGALSTGDYEADKARFQMVSIAAAVLGLVLMARLCGAGPVEVALLVVLGLAGWQATDSCARVGNVARLQLGGLALCLWLAHRGSRSEGTGRAWTVASGAALGLLAALKPNVGFAALFTAAGWIASGRGRRLPAAAFGAAFGALLAAGLSALWFGSLGAWRSWARQVPVVLREFDSPISAGNLSLARVLESQGLAVDSRWLLAALFLALVAALWRGRRRMSSRPAEPGFHARLDVLLCGAGASISVLGVDLAWLHYYVIVLPLAVALLLTTRGTALVVAALATALVSLDPVTAVAGTQDNTPLAALGVAGGSLLLFALALYDVAFGPAPVASGRAGGART